MQAIFWIFICVLIPLVGIVYAARMILLCLLPERLYSQRANVPD